jgi:hypothetical protein
MFRFTIRDVLWLTVVVALGVLLWSERAVLQKQRAAWQAETAAERDALKKERAGIGPQVAKITESLRGRVQNLENEVSELRERLLHEVRKAMPVSEAELEAIKRKSAELGAPQPQALPPGYGEKPN